MTLFIGSSPMVTNIVPEEKLDELKDLLGEEILMRDMHLLTEDGETMVEVMVLLNRNTGQALERGKYRLDVSLETVED